jgi:hypothetical protein
MRRAALAVLLSFLLPVLLFAQHHGSEGGAAPSGGSSNSGGYSGGYSGGSSETYHSSSSSSSSSSSGSSSGGSHSSSGGSGGPSSTSSSNGSSGGSHSSSGGGSSSGHAGTGNSGSHSGSGGSAGTRSGSASNVSPRSNFRTGNSGPSGSGGSENRTGFQLSAGSVINGVNDSWVLQPPQLRLEHGAGTTLDQALHAGQMNAELSKLGLEPTKQAYEQKVEAVRAAQKQSEGKAPNWFSKVFLGKQERKSSLQAAATKPCVGDNCPAPKPCPGKTCRPVPPPCKGKNCLPPPGTCLIANGSPSASCVPWGYIERCDDRQGTCYAHLVRAHASDCDEIRRRLQEEETHASLLQADQQTACSNGAPTAACSSVSADLQREQLKIDQLRKQYQLCMMARNP